MTNSKNHTELKVELKAKTDKLVSQDKELFANLSKEEITEKKKERAKGFREDNDDLLYNYKETKYIDIYNNEKEKLKELEEKNRELDKEFEKINNEFSKESLYDKFCDEEKKLKEYVMDPFKERYLKEKINLDPILLSKSGSLIDLSFLGNGDTEESKIKKIYALGKIKDEKILFALLGDKIAIDTDVSDSFYLEYKKYMDILAKELDFDRRGIELQTKEYSGWIEYSYDIEGYRKKNRLTIDSGKSGYTINTSYIDFGGYGSMRRGEDPSFIDSISSISGWDKPFSFFTNDEPYASWKKEFFELHPHIKQKFDEIDKSLHEISSKQDKLVSDFKEKYVVPLENKRKKIKQEKEKIDDEMSKIEYKRYKLKEKYTIRKKEKQLEIENKKKLLEGNNDIAYMLYPKKNKESSNFDKLYKEDIEERKQRYKSSGVDIHSEIDNVFENQELGISILLYSKDYYVNGPKNTTNHRNGFFVERSDGTYHQGPELRWQNGSGDVDESDRIHSINNVKIINNRIIVEVSFVDGSTRNIDVGIYKLSPVYTIYRNNKSYNQLKLKDIISSFSGENKIIDSEDGIFKQGTDIVENDFIRSIPDDAIIITDNAALKDLPSLVGKRIINIEKDILPGMLDSMGLTQLPFYAKSINSNPSEIIIFYPACAAHAYAEGDDSLSDLLYKAGNKDWVYAEFLKRKFEHIFPNSKIFITDDVNFRGTSTNYIKVVDRHRLNFDGMTEPSRIYINSKVLILPLYENDDQSSISKSDEYIKKSLNGFLDKLQNV